MIIKVDNREKKLITILNAKLEELELKQITIIVDALPIGDIIICDDKCTEKIIISSTSHSKESIQIPKMQILDKHDLGPIQYIKHICLIF